MLLMKAAKENWTKEQYHKIKNSKTGQVKTTRCSIYHQITQSDRPIYNPTDTEQAATPHNPPYNNVSKT